MKPSRMFSKLKKFWATKLNVDPDAIDPLIERGFRPIEFSRSPLELVAATSLLAATMPIHEIVESIMYYAVESTDPVFNHEYFSCLNETVREFELAGWRTHARVLRKLGRVVAEISTDQAWKAHWEEETDRRVKSAIRDEPFLPQKG